jgi:hypothetical protein
MASDVSADMVWEKRWVGRPTDTHFSADGSSPLARADGTNKLETHATLGPRVEEDDQAEEAPDLLKWAMAIRAGVLLGIGAIKAAPHVKSWWKDLRSKRNRRSETSEPDNEAATSNMAAVSSAAFASEVEVALEEHRTRMSSAEAQKRLLAILMATAFIADQMRELSNAQIEDGVSLELQSAMEKLTVPQRRDSLNRMLEAHASLLDDKTSAELMKIFGGGRIVAGQFVPLRNDKIKEALRLPGTRSGSAAEPGAPREHSHAAPTLKP